MALARGIRHQPWAGGCQAPRGTGLAIRQIEGRADLRDRLPLAGQDGAPSVRDRLGDGSLVRRGSLAPDSLQWREIPWSLLMKEQS